MILVFNPTKGRERASAKIRPRQDRCDEIRAVSEFVTRAVDGLLTVRFTESMNEIRPRSARQYSSTEKITQSESDGPFTMLNAQIPILYGN